MYIGSMILIWKHETSLHPVVTTCSHDKHWHEAGFDHKSQPGHRLSCIINTANCECKTHANQCQEENTTRIDQCWINNHGKQKTVMILNLHVKNGAAGLSLCVFLWMVLTPPTTSNLQQQYLFEGKRCWLLTPTLRRNSSSTVFALRTVPTTSTYTYRIYTWSVSFLVPLYNTIQYISWYYE